MNVYYQLAKYQWDIECFFLKFTNRSYFLNLPTDHLSIFEWMGRSSWLALTIWHWRSNANTLDGGTWCYHCLIALSIFAFSFRHLDPPSKQCSGWISLVHLIYPCQCARRHMLRFLKDSTVHWKIFHSCHARCWKHLPAQVMHFIGSWPLSRDVTWTNLGDCGEGGGLVASNWTKGPSWQTPGLAWFLPRKVLSIPSIPVLCCVNGGI